MLLQDFKKKCDKETRRIITHFLSVCEGSINGLGNIASNVTIETNSGEQLSDRDVVFIFLLIICIENSDDLKELLSKHGLTKKIIEEEFKFSKDAKESLKTFTSKYIYNEEFQERGFCNLWGGIIKAYCDNSMSVICIERILYNYLKKYTFCYPLNKLNSDEFLEELLDSAESKENNLNYSSLSSQPSGGRKKIDIPFGNILTQQEFKYNPLVGRTKELRKMSAFLMDDEKSLIIYGSAGTGKTTLIKGLAYNIQNRDVPDTFLDKEIIEVSASELISGCSYVGMVEEKLLGIIKKLIENENSILFIDEIHTLMGLGRGSHSNNDVSNILKPYLGDGRIKIVGATTTDEYKIIKNDGAFSRRFNNLYLPDLTDDEMLNLLLVTSDRFAENKQISINYDDNIKKNLLRAVLNLSKRAIEKLNLSKYNPDFALTLLRMGYDFAALDGKKYLDADYIIEGINNEDSLNDELKEDFKNDVYIITKK